MQRGGYAPATESGILRPVARLQTEVRSRATVYIAIASIEAVVPFPHHHTLQGRMLDADSRVLAFDAFLFFRVVVVPFDTGLESYPQVILSVSFAGWSRKDLPCKLQIQHTSFSEICRMCNSILPQRVHTCLRHICRSSSVQPRSGASQQGTRSKLSSPRNLNVCLSMKGRSLVISIQEDTAKRST